LQLLDKATGKEVVATKILNLKEEKQTFTFDNLSGAVVPSLFRGFSAPVKTLSSTGETDEGTMAFLAANDTDGFNRWEACQKLYTLLILQTVAGQSSSTTLAYAEEAFGRALATPSNEYSLIAYSMMLPTESTLAQEVDVVDPIAIHKARGAVKKSLARKFQTEIRAKYDALTAIVEAEKELKVDSNAIGQRRLRNTLLEYLCSIRETDDEEAAAAILASKHYDHANGMTDKVAAFATPSSMYGKVGAVTRDRVTQQFYDEAQGDPLVISKWFSIQAMADLPDILDRVKMLKEHKGTLCFGVVIVVVIATLRLMNVGGFHSCCVFFHFALCLRFSTDFSLKVPDRCRSLLSVYSANNPAAFHDASGASYQFIGQMLAELDQINPQISSRMATCLIQWRRFDASRAAKMKAELTTLSKLKLSDDLFEIVTKGLKE
jgi:aminopeptidase N